MRESVSKLVKNVLLCEDVRQEINGKFMAAGIYPNDINVKEFPANISLCLYVEFDMKILKSIEHAHFRFFPDRIKPLRIEIGKEDFISGNSDVKIGVFVVPKFIVKLKTEAYINFDVSINKKHWHRLFRKKVSLGPVTTPFS